MRGVKILRHNGFTLIEMVVSMLVISIIVTGAMQMFASNILSLSLSRSRAAGISLANEKMEYLRDLPYDSLATQNGSIYPAGSIPDTELLNRDNIRLKVTTSISYVDDPYDGNLDGTIPGKPLDLYPYDYKKAEVVVYAVNTNAKVSSLTTNFGSKAAETASNTGILRIKVIDANGQPVEDAAISITNTSVSPAVNISTNTDSSGLVVIPKLPPDSNHRYAIVATKAGYSSDQTLADPAGSQVAVQTNPNVLVQQITDTTLSIDKTSSLELTVVDTTGAAQPGTVIAISGAKKTYTSPTVYKYSVNKTTDAAGKIQLSGLEFDSYSFVAPSGKYIVATSPAQPLTIDPNATVTAKMVLTSSSSWPRITSMTPETDNTGSPTTITVNGANFSAGTSVKLTRAGQPDINGSAVTITGGAKIMATLDLTTAATGQWNVVVTSGSSQAIQEGGFSVTP